MSPAVAPRYLAGLISSALAKSFTPGVPLTSSETLVFSAAVRNLTLHRDDAVVDVEVDVTITKHLIAVQHLLQIAADLAVHVVCRVFVDILDGEFVENLTRRADRRRGDLLRAFPLAGGIDRAFQVRDTRILVPVDVHILDVGVGECLLGAIRRIGSSAVVAAGARGERERKGDGDAGVSHTHENSSFRRRAGVRPHQKRTLH